MYYGLGGHQPEAVVKGGVYSAQQKIFDKVRALWQPVIAPAFKDLRRPVVELNLSARAAGCMQQANITYIGELVQKRDCELLKIKNFGAISLREIKEKLAKIGFCLNMDISGWRPPSP